MQAVGADWKLVSLKYDIDIACRGLHKMIVTEVGDVALAVPRAPRAARCHRLPPEFTMGDPAELGRVEAEAREADGSAGPHAPAPAAAPMDVGINNDDESSTSSGGFDGIIPIART